MADRYAGLDATAAAWKRAKPATVEERRMMKKVAQPEHAYTGCVPRVDADDEPEVLPKKRNPPILGYRGHLRHEEDFIGTTFTQGLVIASRNTEPALPLSGNRRSSRMSPQSQVYFGKKDAIRPEIATKDRLLSSGYGEFENASGYGEFAVAPRYREENREGGSSGYGQFDGASGYGEFLAVPDSHGNSSGFRYGRTSVSNNGYGDAAAPVAASGGRSNWSGYGAFDQASGYGEFMTPPSNQTQELGQQNHQPKEAWDHTFPTSGDLVLHSKYKQAIQSCGGVQATMRLWSAAAQTVWQRHSSRTGLLQAVKRSFEKHERTNHGLLAKNQLKEALRDLSCVLTDDQVTALFGLYDKQCTGAVEMAELLTALTKHL